MRTLLRETRPVYAHHIWRHRKPPSQELFTNHLWPSRVASVEKRTKDNCGVTLGENDLDPGASKAFCTKFPLLAVFTYIGNTGRCVITGMAGQTRNATNYISHLAWMLGHFMNIPARTIKGKFRLSGFWSEPRDLCALLCALNYVHRSSAPRRRAILVDSQVAFLSLRSNNTRNSNTVPLVYRILAFSRIIELNRMALE